MCGKLRRPSLITVLAGLTVVTAVSMAYLLVYLVNGISTGANNLDEAKTKQAVQSLISGALDQSAGLTKDNAKWDDAVTAVYGKVDPQWLYDNWGSTTSDVNYDISLVLDEAGKRVAMFSDGEVLTAEPTDFFGPGLDGLIATLPKDAVTFATSSGLIKTAKGQAIVSVAPIMPYAEGKTIPSAKPRLLVLGKTLTPEYVASLGERLLLQDLKLVPATTAQDSFVPLHARSGVSVGYLKWTPDRPGDKAKAAIQGPAIIAISAMIACMLMLTFVSQRLSAGLQKSEAKAWSTANTDTLTSLPNRHATVALLQRHLSELKLGKARELSVMLADLDGFKDVNDSYGHLIGDELLRGIGAGLAVIAERYDAALSRLGGDEFAFVLVGEDTRKRSKDVAEAALKFLAEPMNIKGRIAKVGMSIGVTMVASDPVLESELLRQADVAMYAAKGFGKNQCQFYTPELDAARNIRIKMAEGLRDAMAKGAIQVVFQPIVDARSRRIAGVEALARWQVANGTWVPPDQFISVAEEFGLIDDLGNHVLNIACREAMSWNDVYLSVNVSPLQFRNPLFVERLTAVVDQSGFARNRLELEVTEGYIIENSERARMIIDKLRSLGFRVALDDFGTGYSSIGYLRKFAFDKLKIDRSIVHGMIDDTAARSIILATTSLAASMNMTVTAEGVEIEEEAKLLHLAGCQSLQGYYFGKPQSAQSISALLDDRQPEIRLA